MQQHFELMEKKGHDDPETKILGKKLDEAIDKLQKKMESSLDIRMDKLPAATKEEISAQDASKTPPPTKSITPQVTKSATLPKTTAKSPTTSTPREPNQAPIKTASQTLSRENTTPAKPEVTTPPVTPGVKPTAVEPKTAKPPKSMMVMRPKPTPISTASKTGRPPTAKPTTPKPTTAKPSTGKPPTTKPPKNATSSKVASKTASSKPVAAPGESEATATIIKADPNSPEPSPDDIVLLKIVDNMLDVQFLIDLVAKELQLNIIYDDKQPLTGKVYIQQRGKIYRKDLRPLLEMINRSFASSSAMRTF